MAEGEVGSGQGQLPGLLAVDTAFVLAGQAAFVLGGFLLHFYLSRAIEPAYFGAYGVIINGLTWIESVLETGVPWAIRKLLPAHPGARSQILHSGLKWQMAIAAALFVVAQLAAPPLSGLLRDRGLTSYARLAVVDILLMALYTFYRAVLNAFRSFAAQGLSMACYAVGKLLCTVLLVGAGWALAGALVGNILASAAGWCAALLLVRRSTPSIGGPRPDGKLGPAATGSRAILGFALPTTLFTLASTFLVTIGLFGVKAVVKDGILVARYTAASYLASAPTLLLVAFSLTLFPHLASSIPAGDLELTRAYIRSALRYLALVLLPGTLLVVASSPALITLVYPAEYTAAAPLLNILIVGTGLYSLYMVFANAILAEGRTRFAVAIPVVLVPFSVCATWCLSSAAGPPGAAWATVLPTGSAALAAGAYVVRRFSVRLDWASLARVSLASLMIFVVARLFPAAGALLLPYYLILAVVYLALLYLLREIRPGEVRQWCRAARSAMVGRPGGA